jgi:hypothetical protein
VRTAFGFLQTDYGLSEIEAECRAPECWLSFGSERLVVTVALEMDGEPWVAIDLFEPGPPRSLIIRTSLEFLLEEIGVLGDKDSEGAIRGDVIESKAQSLRKFGHGLLVGDQALVRRLDARGREKRRQRESTLFPPTPRDR